MLQYSSELEPWEGGSVCNRLSGITLVKALCFTCPTVKQSHSFCSCAAKSACAQSPAGKRGEQRGATQTPAFLALGLHRGLVLGNRGAFSSCGFYPGVTLPLLSASYPRR